MHDWIRGASVNEFCAQVDAARAAEGIDFIGFVLDGGHVTGVKVVPVGVSANSVTPINDVHRCPTDCP